MIVRRSSVGIESRSSRCGSSFASLTAIVLVYRVVPFITTLISPSISVILTASIYFK